MVYGASAPRHPRRQILTAQIQPDARQVISRMAQAVAPLDDHGPQFPMGKFEPSKDWTAPTYASPRSRPEDLLLVSVSAQAQPERCIRELQEFARASEDA